jgi:membrane-associated phospholipid phosphatase
VVKPFVGRGRPAMEFDVARILGSEQAGLGYPSGHAGVVMAMSAAAAPHVPSVLRPVLWLTALGVGATRVYVGAHLPLDVAGGMVVGVGTERAVRLVVRGDDLRSRRRQGSSCTPSSARSSWRS